MEPAELTRRRRLGRELKAAGVNVNLAPVTDTVPEDIGPANEPIGKWGRQYGSTRRPCPAPATAFLEGMLEGGVEGTVKHFPGLGRIRNNTDFSSTGITDDVATRDDPFLKPFADGIKAGAGLVMMASARYPSSTPRTRRCSPRRSSRGCSARRWATTASSSPTTSTRRRPSPTAPATGPSGSSRPAATSCSPAPPRTRGEMLEALATGRAEDDEFAAKVDASVERVLDAQGADGPAALLHDAHPSDARPIPRPDRPRLRPPRLNGQHRRRCGTARGQAWTSGDRHRRVGGQREVGGRAPLEHHLGAQRGHHRAVVGAQARAAAPAARCRRRRSAPAPWPAAASSPRHRRRSAGDRRRAHGRRARPCGSARR